MQIKKGDSIITGEKGLINLKTGKVKFLARNQKELKVFFHQVNN